MKKMRLATFAVVTTPLVLIIACSNEKGDTYGKAANLRTSAPKQDEKYVEVPYTVRTTYQFWYIKGCW